MDSLDKIWILSSTGLIMFLLLSIFLSVSTEIVYPVAITTVFISVVANSIRLMVDSIPDIRPFVCRLVGHSWTDWVRIVWLDHRNRGRLCRRCRKTDIKSLEAPMSSIKARIVGFFLSSVTKRFDERTKPACQGNETDNI